MYKYISSLVLGIIIALIMGAALWSPGAILLLDYIFTDNMPVNIWMPLWLLIPFSLTHIVSYIVVSKVFFVLILIVAAYLGVLSGRRIAAQFAPVYRTILEVFGGIFFLISPYAYERMMVQPGVYLSIILLGYAIYHLYFSHRIILAGLCAGLALATMPHASYMILVIFGLYALFFLRSWRTLGYLVIAGVIALIVNLNWILAPYFGHASSIASISTFSPTNMEAFETQALAPLDVISTNLLLYGFWGERYGNHYAGVGFLSSLWYVAGFLMLGIILFGLWSLWRQGSRKLTAMLGTIALLSLIFGIGIASPLTEGLALWMGQYIPLWQGYREPQKWIGLLMIVEGIGLIAGLTVLLEKFGKDIIVRYSIFISIFLLFLIWSPGPLMGYHGQLRTTVYPSEFEEVRGYLLEKGGAEEGNVGSILDNPENINQPTSQPANQQKILALPWHSYIGCSWMGRPTISNPIKGLLSPLTVTSSDNIEVGPTLYSNSKSAESADIEKFISTLDYTHIAGHNYSHILLMRECANSDTYAWLGGVESCILDTENRYISLYRCGE